MIQDTKQVKPKQKKAFKKKIGMKRVDYLGNYKYLAYFSDDLILGTTVLVNEAATLARNRAIAEAVRKKYEKVIQNARNSLSGRRKRRTKRAAASTCMMFFQLMKQCKFMRFSFLGHSVATIVRCSFRGRYERYQHGGGNDRTEHPGHFR